MHPFARLTSTLVLAGCASTPQILASAGIGCERAEHGAQSRSIAIYTRVVAERVCVMDASGRCHPRTDDATVQAAVRLPVSQQSIASALGQEFGRRGVLARIARPRGPKMFASAGEPNEPPVIELGDIILTDDAQTAYVMVQSTGVTDYTDWPLSPGGDLVRLQRTVETPGGLSRRMVSPVRACWRIERSATSALAE